MRDRFLREARTAGGIQHPNIVTVYDLGEAEDQLYIAMELVEGRDLSDLITLREPLPLERKLDIVGIGYRAQVQGKAITLALGYSHPVVFPLPDGITAEIERQVAITLKGADKALLGQTAAKLRALREPDPYKGKGIKYSDEVIRRKVGKKAGAGAK